MRGRRKCCIGCGLLLNREMAAHGQASEQLMLLLICCRENTLCPVYHICPRSRDQPCDCFGPDSSQPHKVPIPGYKWAASPPPSWARTRNWTYLHSSGRSRCEDRMGILFSLCSGAIQEHNQTHRVLQHLLNNPPWKPKCSTGVSQIFSQHSILETRE